MLTVVKVIGVIVVVVVLIVGLAAWWFIRQIRKAIKAELNAPDAPPCRVNLEPETAPQWRSADRIKQYADEFRALGFEEVGAFSIPEMGGLQLFAFVHPTERLAGAIYDHKAIEPTFDICCDFENGAGLSATNSADGTSLDKRPDHPILWLGKNSVRAVLEAVQNHPQPAARKPITRDEFVGHFKKSYAESMNWRLKKGGISREEIRRQAQRDGYQLDDEQLEEVYQETRAANLRVLQEGCVAQYLDETQPAVADWEPIRQRVFAIPETMESKEVMEAIASVAELDEEQRHQLGKVELTFGETAPDFMEKVLAQDIGALGLDKLGEVKEPVRAFILLAPATEPFEIQKEAASC